MNGGNVEKGKDLKLLFMESISSCHSITKVNGKLMGDPIDIKMFEATGWTLNENLENQENYDSLISTYIRPAVVSTYISPAEKVLWNALLNAVVLDTTGLAVTTNPTRTVTTGAGASTATVVFTGTTTGLALGDVINFAGATQSSWNQPATIITAPVAATNTTATVQFAEAPLATQLTLPTGTMKAYKGAWAQDTGFSYASTLASNKNQLQKFGMLFVVDNNVYAIDNCALDSVSVDFGLDQIAMAAWAGKGVTLKQCATITGSYLSSNSLVNLVTANYITNKLSTMTLQSNIGGAQNTATASVNYLVPITGGNITISNNLTYLVPNNLGVVNNPIGYFTGTRSVSGNVTAYLRTGNAGDAGSLLTALLTGASTTTEPKYKVQLEMGGGSNPVRVEFEMPGCVLQIPTVDVADVVSTTINFTAQGFTSDINGNSVPGFDVTVANELLVRYYSN
jgi:hypothetical protein